MVGLRNGFLVISGCPRSGTSLCMEVQRLVHGEQSILGDKFPQERNEQYLRQLDALGKERSPRFDCQRYMLEKNNQQSKQDFRDLNPLGFWEMEFTVSGIVYRPSFSEVIKEVRDGRFRVVKVVSQGLLASDPDLIGRVIYMIRHPRSVAKSQERLGRGRWRDRKGNSREFFENITIHSPEMFITVTCIAAKFLLLHPSIPVRFYHFEDLMDNSEDILRDMGEFVGVGDYEKSFGVVSRSLNRSLHEDVESPLWEDAENVYSYFCKAAEIINRYSGSDSEIILEHREEARFYLEWIINYVSDPLRSYNRERSSWKCFRAHCMVNEATCRECISGGVTAVNFKKTAKDIESKNPTLESWRDSPCLFECGMDLDRECYKTISESISNNWWENI